MQTDFVTTDDYEILHNLFQKEMTGISGENAEASFFNVRSNKRNFNRYPRPE